MHHNCKIMKRENLWDIDRKNAYAHWFITGKCNSNEEMYRALYVIFEKIIEVGTISKIIYPTSYVTSLASIIIEKIKSSNQSFRQSIFKEMFADNHTFRINTLIDAYWNKEIKPIEFNHFNQNSNLILLNHPSREKVYEPSFSPLSISFSVSTENNYFELGIKIYTDIYFPYVLCPWKWKVKYDDKGETGPGIDELDYAVHGFDNIELSYANGKRLNFFLVELKSFVDKVDRIKWEHYKTEHWLGYHKMVGETGIKLDYSRK